MEDQTNRISFPRNFKYLRRKLCLSENRDQLLAKIKLKQLHFKELDDKGFEKGKKAYVNRKQLRCLITLTFAFLNIVHTIEMFKHCKILKKINIGVTVDHFPTFLARFSKEIEQLDVFRNYNNENGHDKSNLRGYFRVIPGFRRLKVLSSPSNYFGGNVQSIAKENTILNIYLPILKNLKKFSLEFTRDEQLVLQKLMKQDQICPYVTDLSIEIPPENFENFYAVYHLLENEASDQDEENAKDEQCGNYRNNDDVGDEQQIQVINNELAPFFKFHLFKNLKKLSVEFIRGTHSPLNSFVVEGFKSLQNLEKLSLVLNARPTGTKYLFDGLAYLPLLTRFYFGIKFIKDTEISLLSEFLKKQTQLVSLSLRTIGFGERKRVYQIQNSYLENAWQFLSNKSQLKYLSLGSSQWNLESLSKCLEKTDFLTQLQSLEIGVFDDDVTSESSPDERVKGLCNFLARQKNVLRTLKISFWFVAESGIIDTIVNTLQDIEGLNALYLATNMGSTITFSAYKTFFKDAFSKEFPKSTKEGLPKYQHTFSHLEKALRKLTGLHDLKIELNSLMRPQVETGIDSSVVFKALPAIRGLESISLNLPYLAEALKKNPNQASKLFELQKLKRGAVILDEGYSIPTLYKVCEDINNNQTLRCDLMF